MEAEIKKEKSSLKDIFKCLKVGRKICPEYMKASLFKSIASSILPFVNIVFSYLILDGLIYHESKEVIFLYVGLLIGLNLVLGLIIKLCNYFTSKYSNILSYRMSKFLTDKCYTLDYEQVEDSEVMDLIKRAEEGSNSSGGLTSMFDVFFMNVFSPVIQFVYAIILLSGLFKVGTLVNTDVLAKTVNNPFSALIIILALALSTLTSVLISRKVMAEGYNVMLKNIESNRKYSYLYNICTNYQYGKDIRLYGMQKMLISIMNDKKNSVDSNWRNYSFLAIRLQIIAHIASKTLLLISYIYVGIKAYYGFISIGNVVSYVSAISLLGVTIDSFLEGFIDLKRQSSYLKHYFTYLNLPSKMKYGTLDFTSSIASVEFKNVSFIYPKQKENTISNVSFKIANGEKIALVGPNGAGKTTIIKLLCRLYEASNGEILINGVNIKEYSRDALYKIFSVVFQDYKLFSYSIKDNVCGGDEDANEDRIVEALSKAGIKERIDKMDDGINTIIYQKNKDKGVEISGGEAQKIAIARALYKDDPLVILDEPTSALDPVSEADIYNHFNEMVKHKTSIFISHRMSSCKFCDRIIVMDKGMVEEEGNHNELMKNEGLYKRMWDSQAKYYK